MLLARIAGFFCLARGLRREDLDPDAMRQFKRWFRTARRLGLPMPHAMTLSTRSGEGAAGRVVLLKQADEDGVVFYTNYESNKSRELEAAPRVGLTLYWPGLERQVRLEGPAERTSREVSEAYFASRPRGSQLSAWASRQSRPAEERETMEARYREVEKRFQDQPVPCPPFWGGHRVRPERVEFWQGRPSRFHDRFAYSREETGWHIQRLYP